MPPPASSWCRSASGWATTTTLCSSSWPTRATASTPTSTTDREARHLFIDDLVSTLQTVALDAKVQVEFDPAVVATYRLIGYENRAIADRDFRDPGVDAGAIGAGHAVTALYDLSLREGVSREAVLGTVRLRWTEPGATHETALRTRHRGRRPGAAVRGDRSDLPPRRDRGRRGRGAARGARLGRAGPPRRSSTSPTRAVASRPPTRSTTSCSSSSGWTSSAAEPPASSSGQAGRSSPGLRFRPARPRSGRRWADRSAAPADRRPARPVGRQARRPGRDR